MSTPLLENGNQYPPFAQNGKASPRPFYKTWPAILGRQRYWIIATVLLFVALSYGYTLVAEPVYEAKTILKKDATSEDYRTQDEYARILSMQEVRDEIETESELLRSRVVMEKVVQELDLYFMLQQIQVPGVITYSFDAPLEKYHHELNRYPQSGAPRIEVLEFLAPPGFREQAREPFSLRVNEFRTLELYEVETGQLLESRPADTTAVFNLPLLRFSVDWPNPKPGSELSFHLENHEQAVQDLKASIAVDSPANTSLLVIHVRNAFPYLAQRIANTTAEKFRETRIEHKRETIRYSSSFVDTRLEEMAQNLKTAEEALSDFRSRHRLTSVDESTRDALTFISNLEAEKIKNDLELSEYRSRLDNLTQQLNERDFFDQTYLTPGNETNSESPFSALMQQLSQAELERLELLRDKAETHPDVAAIDNRIAEIKQSLTEYNLSTIRSYEIIINSLSQKQADLNALIDVYGQKASTLASSEANLMELVRNRNLYEKMYVLLSDKREEMRLAELSKIQDIVVIEAAVTPLAPLLPRTHSAMLIGLILGLFAGLAVGLVHEFRSKTISNLHEVEDGLMLSILAILPTYPGNIEDNIKKQYSLLNHLELLTDTRFGFKESYRMLRTKLAFLLSTKRSPIKNNILFTSCEENTGKTTVVTNFSLLLALAGKRVLVIDCDLKNPTVGRFFNIPFNAPGLIDFLTHDYITSPDLYTPLDDAAFRDLEFLTPIFRMEDRDMEIDPHRFFLDVIPSGGSIEHSSELLDSEKFKDYLLEISGAYDYILLDTPPVTRTVDALTLGNFVKNAVLIVKPNYSRKDSLKRAIQDFRQFNVHLLGCVINACDIKRFADDYGYGYGYGYTYQYEAEYPELPAAPSE